MVGDPEWSAAHPRFHLHFTPKYSSWPADLLLGLTVMEIGPGGVFVTVTANPGVSAAKAGPAPTRGS